MSYSLASLVCQANQIEQALVEAGGELTPEMELMLANVDLAIAEKVDGYKFVMDRLETLEKEWDQRAQTLYRVVKGITRMRERIKSRIKESMIAMNKMEVQGVEHRFKLVQLEDKYTIDEKQLPPGMTLVITKEVPDKERIKRLTEAGEKIPGVTTEPNFAMRSYLNKKGD